VVQNLTPVPRPDYRLGVPVGGRWREVLNSDSEHYGGSNVGNLGSLQATDASWHGQPFSTVLTLPPLGALVLQPEND
jgi:1,4-alpha-glucan branching enzyme